MGDQDQMKSAPDHSGDPRAERGVRCPTCGLVWWLNPPARCAQENAFCCIGCKAYYTGEMLAAPDMLAALKLLRSMITEGDVPRYTITPGAALNSFVEECLDPAIAKAVGDHQSDAAEQKAGLVP